MHKYNCKMRECPMQNAQIQLQQCKMRKCKMHKYNCKMRGCNAELSSIWFWICRVCSLLLRCWRYAAWICPEYLIIYIFFGILDWSRWMTRLAWQTWLLLPGVCTYFCWTFLCVCWLSTQGWLLHLGGWVHLSGRPRSVFILPPRTCIIAPKVWKKWDFPHLSPPLSVCVHLLGKLWFLFMFWVIALKQEIVGGWKYWGWR